jgi:hypothetical protein
MSTALQTIGIDTSIVPQWDIEGFTMYFFATNKKCYRYNTLEEVKMNLKGYSKGFYLDRQFVTLTRLRPLLKLIKEEKQPF